jgi:hypothetical protein
MYHIRVTLNFYYFFKAMIHAGICSNNFFASLNIPLDSKHMLNERLHEAGDTIEEIAKHSIHGSGQESQMART